MEYGISHQRYGVRIPSYRHSAERESVLCRTYTGDTNETAPHSYHWYYLYHWYSFVYQYCIVIMEEGERMLTIKSWAEEDRPREKLLSKGRHVLTDAELIAILIRSGTKQETAVEVAKKILSQFGNNLNELAKLSVNDLMKFKGMGEVKAISIVAAFELGRRRKETDAAKREKITSSKDIFEHFRPQFLDLPHEEFHLLLLNRSNHVIRKEFVSRGGISGTVVDPKIIFKIALSNLASSIILCHNHPSGNLRPSDQDISLTKKIIEAGSLLEIPILDHLIITDTGYFSFADEGMM